MKVKLFYTQFNLIVNKFESFLENNKNIVIKSIEVVGIPDHFDPVSLLVSYEASDIEIKYELKRFGPTKMAKGIEKKFENYISNRDIVSIKNLGFSSAFGILVLSKI